MLFTNVYVNKLERARRVAAFEFIDEVNLGLLEIKIKRI